MVFAATRVSYGGVFDQAERRRWIAVPRDSSSLQGHRASCILTGFNYVTNIEDLNTSALVWPGVQSFRKARHLPEIFASHVAPLVPSSNGRDVTANKISCWGCLSMADDVHRKYYFSYLAAFIATNMDQLSLGCKHSRKEYIESGIELAPNIRTFKLPLKRGDDGERKESVRINNCSTLGQRLEFPQIGSEEDGRPCVPSAYKSRDELGLESITPHPGLIPSPLHISTPRPPQCSPSCTVVSSSIAMVPVNIGPAGAVLIDDDDDDPSSIASTSHGEPSERRIKSEFRDIMHVGVEGREAGTRGRARERPRMVFEVRHRMIRGRRDVGDQFGKLLKSGRISRSSNSRPMASKSLVWGLLVKEDCIHVWVWDLKKSDPTVWAWRRINIRPLNTYIYLQPEGLVSQHASSSSILDTSLIGRRKEQLRLYPAAVERKEGLWFDLRDARAVPSCDKEVG
ncbi:hypothetical protein IW262DRAFT_1303020 [Armillaria fumosa]|nr:hypothetical protein IW262DRAFT_1303020 [Armillaria fumosa]